MSHKTIASFDLIYVYDKDVRTMSVGIVYSDGTDELVGPFASNGALGPIRDALRLRDPLAFMDDDAVDSMLTATHFRYMSEGYNGAGQPYPFRVDIGK